MKRLAKGKGKVFVSKGDEITAFLRLKEEVLDDMVAALV
ncbi:hypothetical protein SAMN04488168_14612 [Bacillus sp. 491mf]|nr:hypothetical protein SAMN04488168_14612 [Bacillus sp. 491mf]